MLGKSILVVTALINIFMIQPDNPFITHTPDPPQPQLHRNLTLQQKKRLAQSKASRRLQAAEAQKQASLLKKQEKKRIKKQKILLTLNAIEQRKQKRELQKKQTDSKVRVLLKSQQKSVPDQEHLKQIRLPPLVPGRKPHLSKFHELVLAQQQAIKRQRQQSRAQKLRLFNKVKSYDKLVRVDLNKIQKKNQIFKMPVRSTLPSIAIPEKKPLEKKPLVHDIFDFRKLPKKAERVEIKSSPPKKLLNYLKQFNRAQDIKIQVGWDRGLSGLNSKEMKNQLLRRAWNFERRGCQRENRGAAGSEKLYLQAMKAKLLALEQYD